MDLGITYKELRATPKGGITDLEIAVKIIEYAIKLDDAQIVLKIKPNLVRTALLKYLENSRENI